MIVSKNINLLSQELSLSFEEENGLLARYIMKFNISKIRFQPLYIYFVTEDAFLLLLIPIFLHKQFRLLNVYKLQAITSASDLRILDQTLS